MAAAISLLSMSYSRIAIMLLLCANAGAARPAGSQMRDGRLV